MLRWRPRAGRISPCTHRSSADAGSPGLTAYEPAYVDELADGPPLELRARAGRRRRRMYSGCRRSLQPASERTELGGTSGGWLLGCLPPPAPSSRSWRAVPSRRRSAGGRIGGFSKTSREQGLLVVTSSNRLVSRLVTCGARRPGPGDSCRIRTSADAVRQDSSPSSTAIRATLSWARGGSVPSPWQRSGVEHFRQWGTSRISIAPTDWMRGCDCRRRGCDCAFARPVATTILRPT